MARCPSGQPSASPSGPRGLLPHPQHMATAACFFVCLAVLPHSAQSPPSVQLASASSLVLALLTVRSHHQPPFPLCSLPISPCPLPPPLSEAHQWQPISSATSSLGAPSPSQSVSHPCPRQGVGGCTCPLPSPSTTWPHPFIRFSTHSPLSPSPRRPPHPRDPKGTAEPGVGVWGFSPGMTWSQSFLITHRIYCMPGSVI